MFIDHRRDRTTRYLEWRIRFMGAGALLAVIGMYFQVRWMIWIAVVVLIVGFLLRFAPEKGDADPENDEAEPR